MVDKPYRKMRLPSEFDQPLLSTDLEWMLSSSQSSAAMVIEAIVHDHLASLHRLAYIILGDHHQADLTVRETLIGVIANRHRYRARMGARLWLFRMLVDTCRRRLSLAENHRSAAKAPAKRSSNLLSQEVEILQDADLWGMLDESDFQTRLLVVLFYLYEFSPSEISEIIKIPEAIIQPMLEQAQRWLRLFCPKGVPTGENAEDRIRSSLERRWQLDSFTDIDRKGMVDAALASLDLHEQRKRVVRLFQQIVSMLTVGLLIVIAGWLSNNLLRRKPQRIIVYVTQTSQPAIPTRIPTVIPTPQLGLNDLLAPRTYIEPLNASSSPEEIRLKMIESHLLLGTIRVDGVIIRYGQPGYDNPLPVYRNQMWIRNPNQLGQSEQRLVIAGPANSGPVYTIMLKEGNVHEVDLVAGLSYNYPLVGSNPFYGNYNPIYFGIYGFDNRGVLDGSFLASMLFAAGPVSASGKLKVSGVDEILGREVLIVDSEQSGNHNERLWIETYTGMILRWQGYDDPEMKDIRAEIIVDSLEFGADFPSDSFLSAIFSKPNTDWDAVDAAGLQTGGEGGSLEFEQKRDTQNLTPPSQLNLIKSCLTFQWEQTSTPTGSPGEVAEIFADNFYLGQLALGYPGPLKCKRSIDGLLVACLSSPPGLEGVVYASSNLYWFDLTDLKNIENVFPNASWISTDFAFSPDGSNLAFWGCIDKRERCGIFLQDTQSKNIRELITMKSGATSFSWSPDGEYLSFIVTHPDSTDNPGYVVVRVGDGEIVYDGFLPESSLVLHDDLPNFPGGISPFVTGVGSNRCIQTQE